MGQRKVTGLRSAAAGAAAETLEPALCESRHTTTVFEKVTQDWSNKIRFVWNSRDGHMPQIVYKC